LDSIAVVPYKHKYLKYLKEMLVSQKYPEVEDMDTFKLPKIGYVALYNKVPVAFGFLRKVEGGICGQIDGLTSNPYMGSLIRHTALSMILDRLIEDAKDLKYKGLIAFCLDPSMVKRAESTGFNLISHKTLVKSL
jgi:hypothetical protein